LDARISIGSFPINEVAKEKGKEKKKRPESGMKVRAKVKKTIVGKWARMV